MTVSTDIAEIKTDLKWIKAQMLKAEEREAEQDSTIAKLQRNQWKLSGLTSAIGAIIGAALARYVPGHS